MTLSPLEHIQAPRYPVRWRRLAAALTATAALCLPACGEDVPTRTAGRAPIATAPGPVGELKPPEKPPEIPINPAPEPSPERLGGTSPAPVPRLPGQAPAPAP